MMGVEYQHQDEAEDSVPFLWSSFFPFVLSNVHTTLHLLLLLLLHLLLRPLEFFKACLGIIVFLLIDSRAECMLFISVHLMFLLEFYMYRNIMFFY